MDIYRSRFLTAVYLSFILAIGSLCSVYAQQGRRYTLPAGFDMNKIAPEIIVVKLRGENNTSNNGRVGAGTAKSSLDMVLETTGATGYDKPFSRSSAINGRTEDPLNLQNIYRIRIPAGRNVIEQVNRLLELDIVEYAEPYFLNELLYVPNDPQAALGAGQDNLPVIRAHEAWNITRGDSAIVVGIVDTGVKMTHEDLQNIAVNNHDPINGIDDDSDGFVDNYYGWDLADNDNNPDADGPGHGSLVTGLSSARTNNSTGMAGMGFYSKFLPIKVAETASGYLVNSYEGIIYAADKGCKVINLSWGGVYPYFQYGQDVINYAVLIRDAVVVAAAGNTAGDLDFYPASFDNVISVGASDMADNFASWATSSYHIDLLAPGQAVYTTSNNGGYQRGWGTSYAAPQVSGAAALVRTQFPTLTAQQTMEQIRVTSDDIYDVGNNMNYYGRIGKGRLNMERAVAGINTPSVRQTSYEYSTTFDKYLFSGDTLQIRSQFKNYLGPAQKVTVRLSSPIENVHVEEDSYYIGNLGTGDETGNTDQPFIVRLGDEVIPGERLVLKLDFEGEGYSDFQHFTMTTTPEYFALLHNEASLTIASDGDFGYNRDSLYEGSGVSFRQKMIATWMGLVIAKDSERVSDNVVNNFSLYTKDKDFESLKYARLFRNSTAGTDARSMFQEASAGVNKIGVKVEQKILAWDGAPNHEFFVVEYRVTNTTDSTLHNLDLGLFSDWDLNPTGDDAAGWDSENKLGYVFDKVLQNLYTGIALMSDEDPAYYAIDLLGRNGNTPELDSTFSDQQKYQFLHSGVQKATAGAIGNGNDVAHLTGYNNIDLNSKESKKLTFAILFGSSLEHLRSNLQNADDLYSAYIASPPMGETFHACYGDSAVIMPSVGESFEFYEDPYMITRLDSGSSYTTSPVYMDKNYYVAEIADGFRSDINTVVVRLEDPAPGFTASVDTLLIGDHTDNEVFFTNESERADAWLWSFGNGYGSTVEHPSTFYSDSGMFTVRLVASNIYGCRDSIDRQLYVAPYGESPDIQDRSVCKGDTVHLQAANTSNIRVYADVEREQLLFDGNVFISGPLTVDTVFYITNIEPLFESWPTPVHIAVNYPPAGFSYELDTQNVNVKYALLVDSKVKEDVDIKWYLNDQYAGSGPLQSVDYQDGTPFTLTQLIEDVAGCRDSITVAVTPVASPEPSVEGQMLCRGSYASIRPQNGEIFYYYGDPNLTNLLSKGAVYSHGPLMASTTLYITCMDGLKEGPARALSLDVSPLKADFNILPDTLNLQFSSMAVLENTSIGVNWFYWNFSSGIIDPSPVLYESFESTGTYSYQLIAGDEYNCTDSASKNIVVLNITGIDDLMDQNLKVYPNPAEAQLNIQLEATDTREVRLRLTDIQGKEIFDGEHPVNDGGVLVVDVADLTKGVYIFQISSQDLVYFGRFVKK